ncbi:MAG: hypothetical protein ACREXY_21065 [Gammaproteobacteria bacterium]
MANFVATRRQDHPVNHVAVAIDQWLGRQAGTERELLFQNHLPQVQMRFQQQQNRRGQLRLIGDDAPDPDR